MLEVGCRIGTDTISFARAGALVTAVDLSAKSLALASSRATLFGLAERIRFIQADAEHLAATVPREDYDLVYSFGVIHHTPHPAKAIDSIRHYMSAQSEFRLMIYAADSWKAVPYAVEKYLRYEYELQPWFKSMPVEMFRALERRFGWHLLIRARRS